MVLGRAAGGIAVLADFIRARAPEVLPGLSGGELVRLEARLGVRLPQGMRALIGEVGGYKPCVGSDFGDPVSFCDGPDEMWTWFPQLFPAYLILMPSGCGDYWILDIDPETGACGHVVLASHDAPSIRVHFRSLEEFVVKTLDPDFDLRQYDDLTERDCPDYGTPVPQARLAQDPEIRAFAATLADHYHIFDLRGHDLPCGFAWCDHDPDSDNVRWKRELLFASERRPRVRFWERVRRAIL